MSRTLNAENLTISIPYKGCDKKCEYCISKITGLMGKSNEELMLRNISKVYSVAQTAGVTSVLFTGKGEPMLNSEFLYRILPFFAAGFPCEIQTNGLLLSENPKARKYHLEQMVKLGMDIIAVSMDSPEQFELYKHLFEDINSSGLIARITVNMTDKLSDDWAIPARIISYCEAFGIKQLTFRQVNIPTNAKKSKYTRWIREHAWNNEEFASFINRILSHGYLLRDLNTGVQIFDVAGISLGVSKYCVQDQDNGCNLRSLIFQEDGHVYTSWASNASILF